MACSRPFYVKGVVDFRGSPVALPCRTCMNCRNDIMNEWLLRANYEKTHHNSSLFVTFTYNDFWLKLQCYKKGSVNPSLNRSDLHNYIDTIRHVVKKKYPAVSNFSYLSSAEYGDKFKRPHYHVIFFGLPFRILENVLAKSWHFGSIDVKPLKSGGIRYVLKYLTKQGLNKNYFNKSYMAKNVTPPFITYSKSFGSGVFSENSESIRKYGYIKQGSNIIPVPNYWKYKYFDFSLENIFACEKRLNDFKLKKFLENNGKIHYKNYSDMRARHLISKEKRLYNKAVDSLQFVDYIGRRSDRECYDNLTSPPKNYYNSEKQKIYGFYYHQYYDKVG